VSETPEREVEELQKRSDRLEQEIEDTREDWENKKRDSDVPGAAGDPERAEEGPETGAKYPTKRDEG
jgi:predicted  nucleic acid-binding Zn-ribbon protein